MNRMLKKLRSGRGASITFALLLFLVCAMISSVVLTAATTAAGRIAQIAETDQRYYAVTSACELMKDTIDGKAVSVVEYIVGDKTTEYIFDKAAYEVTDSDIKEEEGSANANKYTGDSFKDIMQCAAYQYAHTASDGFPISKAFTLKSAITGSGQDPVEVTITESVDNSGNMVLTVKNKPKKASDPVFAQKLVFSGTVTTGEYTSLFRIDDENTTVNGTTIKWTLTGVETV